MKYPRVSSYQNDISDEVQSDFIDQYIADQSKYENRIIKIIITLIILTSSL